MMKLANETLRNRDMLAQIITELEVFEFEDRKHLTFLITELYNSNQELMTEALFPKRQVIVNKLVDKY